MVDVNPDIYAIIFAGPRPRRRKSPTNLRHDGYNADALHGDLRQAQRGYVMNRFREETAPNACGNRRGCREDWCVTGSLRTLSTATTRPMILRFISTDPEGQGARRGDRESVSIIHTWEMHKIRQLEKKIGKGIDHNHGTHRKEICQVQLFNLIEKVKRGLEIQRWKILPSLPAIMDSIANIDHPAH